jgi:hypothetical protein
MAANRWLGAAAAVAQVNTITVGGTAANGQIYSVTMGANSSKVVSYTATGADTNTTIAAALAALLAASAFPEFAEVAWTVNALVITGTARTAGVPFTNTSAATGTGTLVTATATVSAGPNDASTPANYSLNALPVNTNDLYIDSGPDILYGLASLSAVVLNSLNIAASYAGNIGLPEVNANGYEEYRQRYLQVGATTCIIGYGPGSGPTRVNIDFGSVQTACIVEQTGTSLVQGLETCQLKGSHASNVLTVNRGQVAWAGLGSDTGNNLATLNTQYITSQASDAYFRGGPGLAIATANVNGGQVDLWNGPTSLNQLGASSQVTVRNGNMTTADVEAGTFLYVGTGAIATLTVGNAGVADFRTDPRSRTVTNPIQGYAGAQILDDFGTLGNYAVVCNHCRRGDIVWSSKPGHTVTLS